ncbi:MAG: 5-oxoprolinase subunit PxpB [Pseudomonadota bacterium]
MEVSIAGENALIVYVGEEASPTTAAKVQAASDAIKRVLSDDLIDLVPSYASVLIIYDALKTDHLSVDQRVRKALTQLHSQTDVEGRTITLPVYYDPEVGVDLESLAARNDLSIDDVIAIHAGTEYRVYAIGFAPGFAYLGQVDERIAAPRLATPRQSVPRGTVAIADRQTAVYPAASPGGWNLIGRCPIRMFNPESTPVMPVSVGDTVRFEAVNRDTFLELGGELS